VSDDAAARVRDRGSHSVTVGGNVTHGLTHSSQSTKSAIDCRAATRPRAPQSPVTIRVCDCPRPQDSFAVWTKLFKKLL
jgi:hypothetical protein